MSGRVVVVGSINMDLTVRTERLPGPGETLLATSLSRSGGGKGANQAVAAARAGGARTWMIGAVGQDPDGETLMADLAADGIDVQGVARLADRLTGIALITVDDRAENTIVVAAGANGYVGIDRSVQEDLGAADVILGQLEIPQATLVEAAGHRRPGARFILNAAPSAPLDPELAEQVDILVVNEHEATDLAAVDDVDAALAVLLESVPAVVVTLGAAGARLLSGRGEGIRVPAPTVTARDTVAAGDTFCGVYAAGLADGLDDTTSLRRACAAASLAVQRSGAQPSIPTAEETVRHARDVYG